MNPYCHGIVPITARREPWMDDLLGDHAALASLLEEHGSPVNLIDPRRLPVHAGELVDAAADLGIDLRVMYARKANKALALVDTALAAGHGIDVASERELSQVLARGATPDRVIVSAAVKPRGLLERCVDTGVMVSVDNLDELELLVEVAASADRQVPVALRLAPELPPPAPASRFGLPPATVAELIRDGSQIWRHLRLSGIHFHLHGYDAGQRSTALGQSLDLVEHARGAGHRVEYIDIGGGVPMSYVNSAEEWQGFWSAHHAGLAEARPLTWEGHRLETVYPLWQHPVRGGWLRDVLDPHATRIRGLDLRVHAEPGRALLDGCGLTAARVEFRKQRSDGVPLVGLAMNRTQCRSAADDFLLDPVLVPHASAPRSESMEAYLVGAYCIEAELLTWRRLLFPQGVAVGDVVVFINTAGYQMHILESASHQIPLARNLVPGPQGWVLDEIDQ